MSIMTSQIPPIQWPVSGEWLVGLIGVLGVVYLILGVVYQGRLLFGKHPPLSEEVSRIYQELRRELASTNQVCEQRHGALRVEVDERFRDLSLERVRSLGELHEKINMVAGDIAFIRGRLAAQSQLNQSQLNER